MKKQEVFVLGSIVQPRFPKNFSRTHFSVPAREWRESRDAVSVLAMNQDSASPLILHSGVLSKHLYL